MNNTEETKRSFAQAMAVVAPDAGAKPAATLPDHCHGSKLGKEVHLAPALEQGLPERVIRVGIISDIHYAGAIEKSRGDDFEVACLSNPLLRLFVRSYRRFFWLNRPLHKGYLLDRFLDRATGLDYLVGNGDYSCDTACTGVSDQGAFESAGECIFKLRRAYGDRLRLTFGDHELGKLSFFGRRGGMRLASWRQAREGLGLEPVWTLRLGNYVLIGVVSSLLALPVFEPDTLPEERPQWHELRHKHLEAIREVFALLRPEQRVLLFCHDPTALPFLLREAQIQARVNQIEHTVIGHLHSHLVLWKSRFLAGIPRISFLGHTTERLSTALREAHCWRAFRVRLCPALAGLELLKDGGFLTLELDPEAKRPATFQFFPVPR